MRVLARRVKMIGLKRPCEYSYSLYVPEADIPAHVLAEEERQRDRHRTILSALDSEDYAGHKNFVSFEYATRPKALCAMEQGWDKYAAHKAHEMASAKRGLVVAQMAFPELSTGNYYNDDVLPLFWIPMPFDVPGTTIKWVYTKD